ncbi:MAG: bifunctional UDP-3-O-[Paludibacteraceae bacterium]|nr:bifunctional UDP-3-O-[3-hydroxymyristoyl] N-acetylglucosamine deacetylase/3-hydroxyacyl-ACP dehydratase [Paludibacteraceae bacterium]
MAKQMTLKAPFTLEGKGLHTGLNVVLTVKPAAENTGRVVRRVDLETDNEIPALAENVIATERGTVLAKGDVKVSTIEHCMAALYAVGVDNCEIEVNAPEFPILDGSAKPFIEAINSVGVEEQSAEKEYYEVTSKKVFTSEDGKSSITILPDTEFSVQAMVSYDSCVLGNQYAILDSMKDFEAEVAGCRTFVFVREIAQLVEVGLIKGGDLNNALVIYDQEAEQEQLNKIASLLGQEAPQVSELGYLNGPLQFDNEPARHKLLDVIGDLALIGRPIKGRVIAVCPGHGVNTAFAKQIRKEIRKQEVFAPVIAIDAKPVLDINQIKELLPHRYPFLLVDKVMEVGDNHIVAIKNATFNEMHFIGHFPDEPVMPGVLHVEAMAQCAGILVLSQVEDPKAYSTYFLKIDGVKFRNKVVPGDTIVMKVMLTSPIRRGLATIKGYCFVNGKITTEAEMTAQIVKNK